MPIIKQNSTDIGYRSEPAWFIVSIDNDQHSVHVSDISQPVNYDDKIVLQYIPKDETNSNNRLRISLSSPGSGPVSIIVKTYGSDPLGIVTDELLATHQFTLAGSPQV